MCRGAPIGDPLRVRDLALQSMRTKGAKGDRCRTVYASNRPEGCHFVLQSFCERTMVGCVRWGASLYRSSELALMKHPKLHPRKESARLGMVALVRANCDLP